MSAAAEKHSRGTEAGGRRPAVPPVRAGVSFVNLKPTSVSISFDGRNCASFDLAGRPIGAFLAGVNDLLAVLEIKTSPDALGVFDVTFDAGALELFDRQGQPIPGFDQTVMHTAPTVRREA